ncbi:MAG: tetratricopeptide repeat protein [Bacteroidota bacterium]
MKAKKKEKKPGIFVKYRFQLLIVLLVFVLYGNTVNNKYSLDDDLVVDNQELVAKGIGAIPEIFTSLYTVKDNMKFGYRPIVLTTFAIEHSLFGKKPGISHLVNILLYVLTGLLLFKVLRTMFRDSNPLFSFLITVIFLAHPLHTEVVASLKNRDEMLNLIFSLLALSCYFRYVDKKQWFWLLPGSVLFLLAVLSKLSALPFLVVFPLTVYFFRKISFKQAGLIFISAFAVIIFIRYIPKMYLPDVYRMSMFFENPLYVHRSIANKTSALFVSFYHYIKLILVPYPLRYYYGYNTVDVLGFDNYRIYIAIVAIATMMYYALKNFRKKDPVAYAILLFVICLSMFLNFVRPNAGIIAERFLYNASIGFSIAFVYLLYRYLKLDLKEIPVKGARNKLYGAVIIILLIYAIIVIPRNQDWKNRVSLFSHDIEYLENSAKANDMYASSIASKVSIDMAKTQKMSKEQYDMLMTATKHYKRAIEIYPEYAFAMNKLGSVYVMYLNDVDQAIKYFSMAVKTDTAFVEGYTNLSYCYKKMGKFEKAKAILEKALLIEPDNSQVKCILANAYLSTGDTMLAIRLNEEVISCDSSIVTPYINLGKYYILLGDTIKGIRYFEDAYRLQPESYDACFNLAYFYNIRKDYQKVAFYNQKMKEMKSNFEQRTKFD